MPSHSSCQPQTAPAAAWFISCLLPQAESLRVESQPSALVLELSSVRAASTRESFCMQGVAGLVPSTAVPSSICCPRAEPHLLSCLSSQSL